MKGFLWVYTGAMFFSTSESRVQGLRLSPCGAGCMFQSTRVPLPGDFLSGASGFRGLGFRV